MTKLLIPALVLLLACGPDPLSGTTWDLVAWNGHAAEDASVTFIDDREFKGWTGCNSFWGEYEAGDSFSVTELVKQEAGCPTQGLFEQEQALVKALVDAERYKEDGSRLVIMGADGVLVFEESLR